MGAHGDVVTVAGCDDAVGIFVPDDEDVGGGTKIDGSAGDDIMKTKVTI
jgi:hypothetical protein